MAPAPTELEWVIHLLVEIRISLASFQEKTILRNLIQYYLYEFSELDGVVMNESGLFDYHYLDHYWTEPDRYPFLVRVDDKLAGFALLRRGTYFPRQEDQTETPMIIAEFFVMKNYRRNGVGTQVAFQLFDRFPGRWEIAQEPNNIEGQDFWRRVIGDYCGGDYLEFVLDDSNWEGPVQFFDNSTNMVD